MSTSFLALVILAVFFVYIGARHRNLQHQLPTRGAPLKEVTASIFSVMGAGEYVFIVSFFVSFGAFGSSYIPAIALALYVISNFISEIRRIGQNERSTATRYDGFLVFSTPDYVFHKFGRSASIVATLMSAIAFTALLWVQFIVGGQLISAIAEVDFTYGAVLVAVTVGLYVIFGGFKAMFHTDFWQGLFMWIGLIIGIGYVYFVQSTPEHISQFNSLVNKSLNQDIFTSVSTWAGPTVITGFISTCVATLSAPDIWERAVMAESDRAAERGLNGAAIGILIFALPMLMLSVDLTVVTESLGREPLLKYFSTVSAESGASWPPLVLAVFGIGLLSAFVSTADSSALVVATLIHNEINRKKDSKIDSEEYDLYELNDYSVNITLTVIVTIGLIGALFFTDLTNQFTGIVTILSAMGGPVALSMIGYGGRVTFIMAISIGAITSLSLTYLFPSYNVGYGLVLPLIPSVLCFLESPEDVYNE